MDVNCHPPHFHTWIANVTILPQLDESQFHPPMVAPSPKKILPTPLHSIMHMFGRYSSSWRETDFLSKYIYFIFWFCMFSTGNSSSKNVTLCTKILSRVLQSIVTLGYMPVVEGRGVLHLCGGAWRRLVKRTPWTLDKVWGCQNRKCYEWKYFHFSERAKSCPCRPPIRGSVKAAHMRGFIRADDAWEPFGGVSQGIRRVHHYYLVETGPGQPWLQN